ncbi:hypothetical protein [Entomospira culicis]|uniref:Uncharacterized protein n=1 Tax=Entomospira culicis TaxID=2719989 RepID=A0A968KX92_9SPIO|nr:hypothetical protein [Entomospira culicis]NIZ19941.1 hypothetical protein [Entomospira culicis]NIZ70102.1 hypothetical protein [Entomospira culicis]WDI38029.1 hypothetical protein PVA46_07775 [Entomospira culicis]WDI39652.1 hypothetical protein PVA47_07775 [Entomospira culicis]
MKRIWMIGFLALATLSVASAAPQVEVRLVAKKDDKKKPQVPQPPKEPSFRLVDVPLVNYVLITEKDWQALEAYFDAFDQYAEDADRELAKIKKLKKEKKRPKAPRLNLSAVASNELPALLRNSKEKYLSISDSDRRTLESNLKEMREYITETQRLFNSNTK